VRDQVRNRLDYTFEDLGEQQVKNGVLGHLAVNGHHLAPVDPFKSKQIGATPCLPVDPETNRSDNTIFSDPGALCTHGREKSG